MTNTDPTLWTRSPKFGPAGGPDSVVLTTEGRARAFSVGAQVRQGAPARALEALATAGGTGLLSTRQGSRLTPTELGKFDQMAWGHLRSLGYVESEGETVRLTSAGRLACLRGEDERARLLERCRRASVDVE